MDESLDDKLTSFFESIDDIYDELAFTCQSGVNDLEAESA